MVWSPLSNYLLYGETADIVRRQAGRHPDVPRLGLGAERLEEPARRAQGGVARQHRARWRVHRPRARRDGHDQPGQGAQVGPPRRLDRARQAGRPRRARRPATATRSTSWSGARESSVALVRHRRRAAGRPARPDAAGSGTRSLTGADWIDEITRRSRPPASCTSSRTTTCSTACRSAPPSTRCVGAMARLPELAVEVDSAARHVRGRHGRRPGDVRRRHGGGRRHVPRRPRLRGRGHGRADRRRSAFAMAAEPYSFWVTDPIDARPAHGRRRPPAPAHADAGRATCPSSSSAGCPAMYGQTIALPDSASFLVDAGPAGEQLRATTVDLPSVLASAGQLTLDERKLIVDQAIVLLTETYVHLPFKRAMHAIDPVQRLRLLRHRLDETDARDDAAGDRVPRRGHVDVELAARPAHRLPAARCRSAPRWRGCRSSSRRCGTAASASYLVTKWVLDAWPDPRDDGRPGHALERHAHRVGGAAATPSAPPAATSTPATPAASAA